MPKAILFDELGGADVLRVAEVPDLEPAEGEVRISVEALGINRAEIMVSRGTLPRPARVPLPHRLRGLRGDRTPWVRARKVWRSGTA